MAFGASTLGSTTLSLACSLAVLGAQAAPAVAQQLDPPRTRPVPVAAAEPDADKSSGPDAGADAAPGANVAPSNSPSGSPSAGSTSASGGGLGTLKDRDRQFEQLARDVQHLEQEGRLLRRVVALIKPTVVHIDAERGSDEANRTAGRRPLEETGSGVIVEINHKHYILTNRHVIKSAPLGKIKIRLADGRQIAPTKAWADRGTDVAVLAINAPDVVTARIGNSDQLDIGDFVLAVGSPFGLSHSVTYGIISAKGRRDLQLGSETVSYQDFLQTDAAINPGNSGGPLINLRGEVVGLNTAIASSSGGNDGIGFSIPINMAIRVASQLVDRGQVVRAYLGVHLDVRFNEDAARRLGLAGSHGARVTQVTPKSPAADAKLQVDDVIVEFDGTPIADDNHLVNLVSLTPVGKAVPIQVWRKGKPITLEVSVTERERFEGPEK